MDYYNDDECHMFMRDNSHILNDFELNPFDLIRDTKYNDTEINCSDYLIEGQSNENETQSNSNSEKKSCPKSGSRELIRSIISFKSEYMDFDENLKPKKKKNKKFFKVIVKKEDHVDQILEKNLKNETYKDRKKQIAKENEMSSKSKLMKIKRIKQKKLLERTRFLKRIYYCEELENDNNEKEKKESISKKKKALQNRISAQKSIEKKKNIINHFKNEKENLLNENFLLKLELERKNNEIEILMSKLNVYFLNAIC